ncbi:hypothetical protein [Streptococcus plurextorum]|uniref:hypothetical protein n=1 Tax=Streptococcus plurextorum TaxID=456876 RepID=UPI00041695BA|nr:hypothetical protein [Streptococcus plurextorum]
MNNLLIIVTGTVVAVSFIKLVIAHIRLRHKLKEREVANRSLNVCDFRPKGFIDYKTGRRVDIDPETRKEVFVD